MLGLDADIENRLQQLLRNKVCAVCELPAERFVLHEGDYTYYCNACKTLRDEGNVRFRPVFTSPFKEDNVSDDQLWQDFIHDEPEFLLAEDEFVHDHFDKLKIPSDRKFKL